MMLGTPADLNWVTRPGRNVEAYAYSEAESRLYAVFQSGHGGYYSRVTPGLFAEFEQADSKGSFVLARLKDNPACPWTSLQSPPSPGRSTAVRSGASGTKYRFRCLSCSATRTLPAMTSPMPKHSPKGRKSKFDCVGSGSVGTYLDTVFS